ncbi:hypothetical protein K505DRAFT_355081 [Melanomma pulvis-pyrius CBS 109.77]|uniref:RING-type domain-containing protein n=1 Tax=Melanomma pulvis-pyrius CBS 109.77 TaxID=1314802 RepID=A0A6A6Y087_9PLEO|nr:hypothetical protein K505DRAFT_355081 [Melanomma pulvis-pyrius CBS 109.77]
MDEYINDLEPLLPSLDCSLCLGPYMASHMPVKLRFCGHVFGDHCIVEWFESTNKNSNTCPLCREELFEQENIESDGEETGGPENQQTGDEDNSDEDVSDVEELVPTPLPRRRIMPDEAPRHLVQRLDRPIESEDEDMWTETEEDDEWGDDSPDELRDSVLTVRERRMRDHRRAAHRMATSIEDADHIGTYNCRNVFANITPAWHSLIWLSRAAVAEFQTERRQASERRRPEERAGERLSRRQNGTRAVPFYEHTSSEEDEADDEGSEDSRTRSSSPPQFRVPKGRLGHQSTIVDLTEDEDQEMADSDDEESALEQNDSDLDDSDEDDRMSEVSDTSMTHELDDGYVPDEEDMIDEDY